ncbi:ROK family protein [Plantactinospora sp. KBS50]|uniref:ROK family protein n=1 Tax=Plantactinospora sp. KBS50 TaxID=2024580 RepID=UPI0018DFE4A9|nr:ROK family protein [Plantactinospora sp. KBS50]
MGGTTTRVGVWADGGLRPGITRFATPGDPDTHLDAVAAAVTGTRAANPGITAVGVAVGATVDATGTVRNASMMWRRPHTGLDLAGALRQRLPWARITVRNDIAAAAWRYRRLGRYALVTISTGVAVKVFDDRLPTPYKLVEDPDGLGGEVGHVPVRPPGRDHRRLGAAAAAGDPAARRRLAELDLPWCECGNVDDLCSHASGPAAARAALRAGGGPVGTRDIAAAARTGDPFVLDLLRTLTRPLALYLLQLSAQLGLRRMVVMGGFAHGVGEPWFAALRANLGDLLPSGAWFTGWTGADLDALVTPSLDGDDSLAGIGCLLADVGSQVRSLDKPIGVTGVTVRRDSRPACGAEQFLARIHFAGICGTDVQILRGDRGWEPGVLGHECVGEAVEVGANVRDPAVGTVFAVNPNHPYDEHDKIGHNLPGVWRDIAPFDGHLAERGQLIELPATGSADWVLLEPLACTVRSLRLAGERWKGRTVLVVGAGVSGLLHVLLARRWNADRVLLANRGAGRLSAAIDRGIVEPEDCLRLDETLLSRLDGGVDAVIMSTAGNTGGAALDPLWPVLADGATVHLFGGFPADAVLRPYGREIPAHPVRSRGERVALDLPGGRTCTLVGSRGADRDDFETAVRACVPESGGTLELAPLISHVLSLEAAPRVLAEIGATGRIDGRPALRAVIDLRLDGDVVRPVEPGAELPAVAR